MNSYSIYIPRAGVDCNETLFRNFFQMICFGDVARVDFVALDDAYSSNGRFHKAFVHFNLVYNTQLASDITTTLSNGESYRLYPRAGEHWILLKNKLPVPTTTMNIHQLAENHRLLEEKTRLLEEKTRFLEEKTRDLEEKARDLEEKARDLEEKSKGFEETVAKQDDMLDRSHQTIYQIIPLLNMSKRDERLFTRVLLGLEEEDVAFENPLLKKVEENGGPFGTRGEQNVVPFFQKGYEEDDDFDFHDHFNFLGEDIEDNMRSFVMLEKKYGPLTFNNKTNDFTDGDGFVRYVLSKPEIKQDEEEEDVDETKAADTFETPPRLKRGWDINDDPFGTEPFLKYADFRDARIERERIERERIERKRIERNEMIEREEDDLKMD